MGKKIAISGTETTNFQQTSDGELQISDRKNLGAQNFNFALKFPQNGGFQTQILHFRMKTSYKIFGQPKI